MATAAPARGGQRRGNLFFGWAVVAAAFAVLFVAYGLQFSFGLFVKAIGDDTGWSRRDLSLPYAVYVALYSLLSSVSGRLTDRYGPRLVVLGGGLLLGIGWAGFGLSQDLWHTYIGLGVVAAFGMSAAWVPCNATVVRWFVRRRGLAVGISSAGGSAGNLVAPPLVAVLIAGIGWRASLVVLGAIAVVGLAVAARFMVRDPESRQLLPDGDRPAGDGSGAGAVTYGAAFDRSPNGRPAESPDPAPPPNRPPPVAGPSMTLDQARRTTMFWVLFAVFALTWLAVFVPFVHLAPFAEDLGMSVSTAALAVSAVGFGGVVGRLGVGWASDRLGRRSTLATMLALQVLAFVGFAIAGRGGGVLFAAATLFGFSYGGAVTLFPALVGDAFGRTHAGSITGALFAASGSMAAIGPFAAGWLYDALGSYRVAFLLCAAANAGAAVLLMGCAAAGRSGPPSTTSSPLTESSAG
jgi:MFS family permease